MCLYICIQPYICNFIYIIPLKFSKERIRLAKSMFMTENKKYIDIAFECGFNSVSSFNRSFKKVKGILLGTFTQMEREQPVSAVYSLLKRYINEELPVVKTEYIGHGEDSKAIQIGKKYKF